MDVFICHARADQEVVESICALLRANNITYWIDKDQELAGGDYIDQINAAIDQSQMLLMLGSQNAMTSDDVMGEIQHAKGSKTPIIPVKLGDLAKPEEAKFEYIVGVTHYLTYAPTEEFSRALLNAIAAHRKTPLGALKFVALKKYANRKFGWWMAAIAALAVVALLLGLVLGRTSTPSPDGSTPVVTTTTTAPADDATTTTSTEASTTTTTAAAVGINQVPDYFADDIERFQHKDRQERELMTRYVQMGKTRTISIAWPNPDCYSADTSVATIENCEVTAVSPGETYVVIAASPTMCEVYRIVVE